jgi:hypothetical protein
LLASPPVMLICAHSCILVLANFSTPAWWKQGVDVTYHVELRAHGRASSVQRNELATEKVLAWCNALGDGDGLHALVGDQAVDAPCGAVEGILLDLCRAC